MKFENIAIIGSGTMGTGIAQTLAVSGYYVTVMDTQKESLRKCVDTISHNLERMVKKGKMHSDEKEEILRWVRTTLDIQKAVKNVDLIIEAVTEDLNIKKEVFHKVSLFAPEESIITSNTSSFGINQLSSYVKKPERFLGLHFFNPAPVMELVEVVKGEQTRGEYVEGIVNFVKTLNKTPIIVQKDIPGFIVNRILIPTITLGIHDLKKWSKEEIDSTMHYEYGLPMGVIKLADFIGLDVVNHINENIGLIETPNILRELVKNGKLGRKTGIGFYDWENKAPEIKDQLGIYPGMRLISTMVAIAVELASLGVAKPEVIDMAFKLGTNVPKGPFELLKEKDFDEIISTLNTLHKEFRSPIFIAPEPKTKTL
ncbi:MAG: NAD(P)-binding domain-containing protein [Candidatus Hydrothermae bacterium]|nr:NAD(P)-binding domain-containing protein [Candidatus Hydrothermae bacterium]